MNIALPMQSLMELNFDTKIDENIYVVVDCFELVEIVGYIG